MNTLQRRVYSAASLAVLAFLATVIGVWSLRYTLPHVPSPSRLTNFAVRHWTLCLHAVTASIALLVGPWQFILAAKRGGRHGWLGRLYGAAVLFGGVTALLLGLHAQTGAFASAGFFTLGIFWLLTTGTGITLVVNGRIAAHRRWMIRSYGLTTAAITLRIYLALGGVLHAPFAIYYPWVAWMCWVPNAILAEVIVRRRPSAIALHTSSAFVLDGAPSSPR